MNYTLNKNIKATLLFLYPFSWVRIKDLKLREFAQPKKISTNCLKEDHLSVHHPHRGHDLTQFIIVTDLSVNYGEVNSSQMNPCLHCTRQNHGSQHV